MLQGEIDALVFCFCAAADRSRDLGLSVSAVLAQELIGASQWGLFSEKHLWCPSEKASFLRDGKAQTGPVYLAT